MLGYGVLILSSYFMVLFSNNSGYAYILGAVYGLYVGITETVQRAIIPRYVRSEVRGTAYGLYNLVIGVTFFVGNIVFGYLWDVYGLATAISYSSIFAASAIVGLAIFIIRNRSRSEN